AHHELFLAVQPIELLAVQHVAFPFQQPAQAPIAEAAPLRGQLAQPLPQHRVVRPPRPIVHARTIKPDQPACAHLAQPALLDQSSNRHLPRHRLQTFFPSRSLSAALSSIASASSFFSRRFSSSSDFNRRASDTSSPPYFAFHLMGWTAPPHLSSEWLTTRSRGRLAMKVHILGIDLAKNVFQLQWRAVPRRCVKVERGCLKDRKMG